MTPGSSFCTLSSSDSRPSATSCSTTVAVKVLVILAMRTLSCGCMGWPVALSATPATTLETCRPCRDVMITPGTPSATILSAACCNPAGGLPGTDCAETCCPDPP